MSVNYRLLDKKHFDIAIDLFKMIGGIFMMYITCNDLPRRVLLTLY